MTDHDDFQFRPLTEGLGFHPKTEIKAPASSSPSSAGPVGSVARNSTSALDLTQAPLPRKEKGPASKPSAAKEAPSSSTVDEILKTLNNKKNFDFTEKSKILSAPQATSYRPSYFDVSAGLLDAMLITAASLLCTIILLVVTRVDLVANLAQPDANYMIYASLGFLLAGISWIYLVANRVFLGHTPGEWVFDQRIGKPEQMGKASYSLKVAARSTVIIATGFILFPLFSLLFGTDLLGKMFGAELVKKV